MSIGTVLRKRAPKRAPKMHTVWHPAVLRSLAKLVLWRGCVAWVSIQYVVLQPRPASEVRGEISYPVCETCNLWYLPLVEAHGVRGLIGSAWLRSMWSALHILCNHMPSQRPFRFFPWSRRRVFWITMEGCKFCRDCEVKNVCSWMVMRVKDGVTRETGWRRDSRRCLEIWRRNGVWISVLWNSSRSCRTSWRDRTRSFRGCEILMQMAVPCDVRSEMHHDKARSRREMSMTGHSMRAAIYIWKQWYGTHHVDSTQHAIG